MRVIAVSNQKGGSCKSSTCVNLAAALGETGRKVLLIDLDPQASASCWYGIKDGGKALLEVFTGHTTIDAIVRDTGVSGVFIVPSSEWMVSAEKMLLGEVAAETILRRAIAKLPSKWDYVFIDCPPSLTVLTINALSAAREVIVPVEAHFLALAGLAHLLRTVDVIKERLNPELKISLVVPCRVDKRNRHSREVVDLLNARFNGVTSKAIIRENIRIAESPSFGQPVTVYDPKGRGAEDYRALARELESMPALATKE